MKAIQRSDIKIKTIRSTQAALTLGGHYKLTHLPSETIVYGWNMSKTYKNLVFTVIKYSSWYQDK